VSQGVRGNPLAKGPLGDTQWNASTYPESKETYPCTSKCVQTSYQFDLYNAATDKQTGQTVAVGTSAPGVLADASERTGLPKDCFELRKISREDYERGTS
jgi:hypothetical protein